MTKINIDALLCDLEIIEEKLTSTLEYTKSLKKFFEKEQNKKSRRKGHMNE